MNPEQATGAIEALAQTGHGVGRVVLTDSQRTLLARAGSLASDGDSLLLGEYVEPLRLAQAAAAEMGWGAVRSLSLRGEQGLVVFSLLPSGLTLGVEAGPATVAGWLREEAIRTLAMCRG